MHSSNQVFLAMCDTKKGLSDWAGRNPKQRIKLFTSQALSQDTGKPVGIVYLAWDMMFATMLVCELEIHCSHKLWFQKRTEI